MRNLIILIFIAVILSGCSAISVSIRQYHHMADQIKLGDSKDTVLGILMPTQAKLPYDEVKSSDTYMEKNDIMEIYYFRSGWQPDNLTTDDEFTPYIFKNSTLIAIGWKTLGGPKSHGKVIPPAPVTNIEHTVIIEKD